MHFLLRFVLITFLLTPTLFNDSFGQQVIAPGGINSDLQLWLRSDMGVTGLNSVTSWMDQSGNGHNAISVTNAPELTTSANSVFPSVRFHSSQSDYLVIPGGLFDAGVTQSDVWIYSVFTSLNPKMGITTIFSELMTWGHFSLLAPKRNMAQFYYGQKNASFNIHSEEIDRFNIFSGGSGLSVTSLSGSETSIWFNGEKTNSSSSVYPPNGKNEDFFIGCAGGTSRFFDGDLSELIVYTGKPSALENEKVLSYLSLKYGISKKSGDIIGTLEDERDYFSADGTVIWDYSDNIEYNTSIIGIGRDDLSGFDKAETRDVSQGSAIKLVNDHGLVNNSFLLIGENNETGIEYINSGNGLTGISKKHWKVQNTGVQSNMDLIVSLDLIDINISNGPGDFVLIRNSSPDFTGSFTVVGTGSEIKNGVISFIDVDLSLDGYLALGLSNIVSNSPFEGPGDVDSDIRLWLRADAGVTGTTSVTSWQDQSGNGFDAVSQGSAPSLVSNSLNGFPAIDFDRNNHQYLQILGGIFENGISYDQISVYTVSEFDLSVSSRATIFQEGVATNQLISWLLPRRNSSRLFFANRGSNGSLSNTSAGQPNIHGFQISIPQQEQIAFLDGAISGHETSNGFSIATGMGSDLTIGAGGTTNPVDVQTDNYDGRISELIIYIGIPDDLENEKINSYLSLKYGIHKQSADNVSTPGIDERDYFSSDGAVIWDFSQDLSFNTDIAGFGRDDASQYEHLMSQSVNNGDILRITSRNSSITADLSFLIWGNNGLDYSSSSNTPTPDAERIERIWRIEETRETGSCDIQFDLTNLSSLPSIATNYVLLVDSDDDFSDATAVAYGSDLTNDLLTFENVNLSDGDYFTFEYTDNVIWDGNRFVNGSGVNGAPGTGDSDKKLLILAPGAEINEDADIDEVEVVPGADLTIKTNFALTVFDKIVNNGTIRIEEDASLVQYSFDDLNYGTGNYFLSRTGWANPGNMNFWSSPMQAAELVGGNGVFNGTNPCGIYTYNASTQQWKYDYVSGMILSCGGGNVTFQDHHMYTDGNPDNIMDVGRGYAAAGSPNNIKDFEGTINNGDIEIDIYAPNPSDNVNILGNPYPSGLSIEAFLDDNGFLLSDGVLYFLDNPSPGIYSYAAVNEAGFVGGQVGEGTYPSAPTTVASGQGFYVLADADDYVVFSNAQRAAENDQFYKTSQEPKNQNFRIFLVDEFGNSQNTLVGLHQSATLAKDWKYDAPLPSLWNEMSIGTKLHNQTMLIQTMNESDITNDLEIPLDMNIKNSGIYQLKFDKLNWPENIDVFVRNNITGHVYSTDQNIEFEVDDPGTMKNVYSITFSNDGQNNSTDSQNTFGMTIYQSGSDLNIIPSDDLGDRQEISILDSRGVTIHTFGKGWSSYSYNTDQLAAGVYLIVNSINGERQEVRKIVVR